MKTDLVIALRGAIDREKDAYELYRRLAQESHSIVLQKLFRQLSVDELKHEALLRECLRGGNLREAEQKMRARSEEFSIGNKASSTSESRELIEGITLAIRKEQVALDLYLRLEASVSDAEQKALFVFLAGEERRHARVLTQERAKLS
jgi:rubrerythrin